MQARLSLRRAGAPRPAAAAGAARGPAAAAHRAAASLRARASKGFGGDGGEDAPSSSGAAAGEADGADDSLEALEARIRAGKARRKGRVEPKVKVDSAVVDQVTGKTAPVPASQAESAYVAGLTALFVAVIAEGLLLAGSGFLPEEVDTFVREKLYPTYSYTVLAFLGGSSLYGLFKTGKLPGMQQL